MSAAARDILHRLADLGAEIERQGNRLLLRAGAVAVPKDVVATIRERKAEILEALATNAEHSDFKERAAIIEEGAGVPRAWAEGFAKLCTMPPPETVPPRRWQQLIDNAGKFIDRFAVHAHRLDWDAASVFGCHAVKPGARLDMQGLVWLICDGELVAITATTARIKTGSGNSLTYRRRTPDSREPMVLAWELTETITDGDDHAA